ncbi:hypothetical protein CDAR_71751 [Caerostris darwini]|uniref:Uncharacterized protein n=1 Tax=Caerostris darwini TaxID=1538125 RepID=A0AAV4TH45_9ARAC|nr:hypothetical protein CDAR_71751 [Caerostris darwini]
MWTDADGGFNLQTQMATLLCHSQGIPHDSGGGRQGRPIAVRNSIRKFFRGVLWREMSIQGTKFVWVESLRSVSIDCGGGYLPENQFHLFFC